MENPEQSTCYLIFHSTAIENLITFFNFNNDLNTSQSTPAFSRLPSTSSLSPDQSGNMREMMAFAFWNLKLVPQFLPRLSQRISQPEFFNRLLTSQLLELQQSRVGSKVAASDRQDHYCCFYNVGKLWPRTCWQRWKILPLFEELEVYYYIKLFGKHKKLFQII